MANFIARDRKVAEQQAQETSEMVEQTKAMIGEVSKVLQLRRLQVSKEPFGGFQSPEGRF